MTITALGIEKFKGIGFTPLYLGITIRAISDLIEKSVSEFIYLFFSQLTGLLKAHLKHINQHIR